MKMFLTLTRWFVGILFIFSGLIKANDPLGLSYKMQEFFEVWNIHWMDHFTLAFSLMMIVLEIVAGIGLIIGMHMKWIAWFLLLLIIFFTFLTAYAYFSGKIRECGCFGNCIPLTAGESFIKDLLLFVLIVFIFINRNRIQPLIPPVAGYSILVLSAVASCSFQLWVLQHLPAIECLPYSIHANIPEQMKVPPGSVPDSTVISFEYQKNGRTLEFTADQFPADFDDSYKFVGRHDKLIRKGNAEPAIKDFILQDSANADVTDPVLQQKGYKLFLFIKDMHDANTESFKEVGLILSFAVHKNIPVWFITSDADAVEGFVTENGLRPFISGVLKCDATAVKTAARTNPALFLLKQGTILNKWGFADFENAVGALNELREQAVDPHTN